MGPVGVSFYWTMAFSCNNVINAGIFDVLAYTDKEAEVPITWIESDAKLIENPQMVKLHSFDTKVVIILILLINCTAVWYIFFL